MAHKGCRLRRDLPLKRFRRRPNGVILQPANSRYDPIILTGSDMLDLRIDGIVVGFASANVR